MTWPAPQPSTADPIRYTTGAAITVGVLDGTTRMVGAGTAVAYFVDFDAGNGPSGGTFTFRWRLNGVALQTCTCPDGDDGVYVIAAPAVALEDGDLLQAEVVGAAGAPTGPAVLGVVVQ